MLKLVEVISHPNGLDQLPGIGIKARLPGNYTPHDGRPKFTRPNSEAVDARAMADGLDLHWPYLVNDPQWRVHELFNEPNHHNHAGHWASKGGIAALEGEIRHALGLILTKYGTVAKCGLGGLLIPDQNLQVVIDMYDRIQIDWPEVQRCAHVYWQGHPDYATNKARIGNAVWDGLRQLSHKPGWVTEFNDSSIEVEKNVRIDNCREAVRGMEQIPAIKGVCLFANDSWKDEHGVEFGYTPAEQADILGPVHVAQPPPGGGTDNAG